MTILTNTNNITGSTGAPQVGSGQANLILTPNVQDPSNAQISSSQNLNIANLNRQVFDRKAFNETFDTSFSELGNTIQPDPSFFDVNLATQEDFWILYDKFFYEIPKDGTTDSHEYLAQTSGDYVNFERDQAIIQALLDEISEIRTENVELRIENVNTTISSSLPSSTFSTSKVSSRN